MSLRESPFPFLHFHYVIGVFAELAADFHHMGLLPTFLVSPAEAAPYHDWHTISPISYNLHHSDNPCAF